MLETTKEGAFVNYVHNHREKKQGRRDEGTNLERPQIKGTFWSRKGQTDVELFLTTNCAKSAKAMMLHDRRQGCLADTLSNRRLLDPALKPPKIYLAQSSVVSLLRRANYPISFYASRNEKACDIAAAASASPAVSLPNAVK